MWTQGISCNQPQQRGEKPCALLIFVSVSNEELTSNVVTKINMHKFLYSYVDVVSKSNGISTLWMTAITFAGNINCTVFFQKEKNWRFLTIACTNMTHAITNLTSTAVFPNVLV